MVLSLQQCGRPHKKRGLKDLLVINDRDKQLNSKQWKKYRENLSL